MLVEDDIQTHRQRSFVQETIIVLLKVCNIYFLPFYPSYKSHKTKMHPKISISIRLVSQNISQNIAPSKKYKIDLKHYIAFRVILLFAHLHHDNIMHHDYIHDILVFCAVIYIN